MVRRIMLSGLTSSTRSGEPDVIDVEAAGLESTNVVERLGAGAEAAAGAGAAGALALAETAR